MARGGAGNRGRAAEAPIDAAEAGCRAAGVRGAESGEAHSGSPGPSGFFCPDCGAGVSVDATARRPSFVCAACPANGKRPKRLGRACRGAPDGPSTAVADADDARPPSPQPPPQPQQQRRKPRKASDDDHSGQADGAEAKPEPVEKTEERPEDEEDEEDVDDDGAQERRASALAAENHALKVEYFYAVQAYSWLAMRNTELREELRRAASGDPPLAEALAAWFSSAYGGVLMQPGVPMQPGAATAGIAQPSPAMAAPPQGGAPADPGSTKAPAEPGADAEVGER